MRAMMVENERERRNARFCNSHLLDVSPRQGILPLGSALLGWRSRGQIVWRRSGCPRCGKRAPGIVVSKAELARRRRRVNVGEVRVGVGVGGIAGRRGVVIAGGAGLLLLHQ